jgi:oxaloacetate decarboxylase alpha subunit
VDVDQVWRASRFIDEHVTSQMPAPPIPPRITLRTAFNRVPVGMVAELDARLRYLGAPDRLDEVLDEIKQVRMDCGMPPLAQPVGGILAAQAVLHVLSARRWAEVSDEMRDYLSGVYGTPPYELAPAAAAFAVEPPPPETIDLDRMRAEGIAASEEDLLLVALFGEEANRLLEALRGRTDRDETQTDGGFDRGEAARIRELIDMVETSGVGELTIEDHGVKITVRRQDDRQPAAAPVAVAAVQEGAPAEPTPASVSTVIKIESPMVGTFYRSPSPTADAFVAEGDRVEVGQTLCVLEAMKLFNEFKSEHAGVIRGVLVENAQPVEYGQPLFELEPA